MITFQKGTMDFYFILLYTYNMNLSSTCYIMLAMEVIEGHYRSNEDEILKQKKKNIIIQIGFKERLIKELIFPKKVLREGRPCPC